MSDYRPWDREEKLGPPPWKHDDPRVIAWEAAHGHDVRLKCYPELGCVLVEAALEGEITTLCDLGEELAQAARVVAEITARATTAHARLDTAIQAWDEHMTDRFMRAIEEQQ